MRAKVSLFIYTISNTLILIIFLSTASFIMEGTKIGILKRRDKKRDQEKSKKNKRRVRERREALILDKMQLLMGSLDGRIPSSL